MRKLTVILSVLSLTWASCSKEPVNKPLTPAQMKHQIDSAMAVRTRELEQEGQKDLQSRLKIEVKVKADSIINARLHPAPAKAATPMPPVTTPQKTVVPRIPLHKGAAAINK